MKNIFSVGFAAVMLALLSAGPTPLQAAVQNRHTAAATASSGAATLDNLSGTITTEALTTAAAASYTLTLTNKFVRTDSIVNVEIDNGSNTQGIPVKSIVTPGSGSVVIKIFNLHATQALNGTLKVRFNLE